MYIDTDPAYGRAMDPDMVLSSSSGPDDIMAIGGNTRTLRLAWPQQLACLLDTNMATSSGQEAVYPCGLWWQQGPWTTTQIPDAVGPQP